MNENNLNREKSALLIIDMQEDFARPSGSAYINGTEEIVSPLADITIAGYHPSYKEAFKELNAAWLNQYFTIEPIDEYVLSEPEDAILKNGGKILFALKDGQPIGTVALKIIADGRLELTKMAVHENYQGCGIGKMLCQQAISVSKSIGMKELVLFSHTNLSKALSIYRKLGFVETEIDKTKYKRADIMMTLQL